MIIRLVVDHREEFKTFNLATYRILGNLKKGFGFDLTTISEPDPLCEGVDEIVKRLHFLDGFGRKKEVVPIPPNILQKYPSRSSWYKAVNTWNESLRKQVKQQRMDNVVR